MASFRFSLLVCCLLFSHACRALDYTDLWYDAANAGWGINVVQSGDLLFLTFFVYGESGQPIWYAAQLDRDTSGDFDGYLGALYVGAGTWFALPWEARRFSVAPVGTASFQPSGAYTASLGYTVRGQSRVAAVVSRQPLRQASLEGHYAAVVGATSTSCAATRTGQFMATLTVAAGTAPGALQMDVAYPDGLACTFIATLATHGRLYNSSVASYACSDGEHGSATLEEIALTQHGLEGRWTTSTAEGCVRASTFAALPR
jgi:hypothetical protein